MKKVYETPEFELKKFDILGDILADSITEPTGSEGELPGGGGDIDTIRGEFKINSSGFGW